MNIVALRAFFHVVEIIEAKADDLAGRRHRQRVFQAFERTVGAGRRTLGGILERRQVAVVAAQAFAEVTRYGFIDCLQIDDLIALDDAEMQSPVCFETDDFHSYSLAWIGAL